MGMECLGLWSTGPTLDSTGVKYHVNEFQSNCYFGVGMPSPPPFALNFHRQNTIPALLIKALAEDGLGLTAQRDMALQQLCELDK